MKLLTREDEFGAERFAAGLAEGEQRGEKRTQRSIYERLVASGKLSPQEASLVTGWNMGV